VVDVALEVGGPSEKVEKVEEAEGGSEGVLRA
jgi:hypothetical protein